MACRNPFPPAVTMKKDSRVSSQLGILLFCYNTIACCCQGLLFFFKEETFSCPAPYKVGLTMGNICRIEGLRLNQYLKVIEML